MRQSVIISEKGMFYDGADDGFAERLNEIQNKFRMKSSTFGFR